MGRSPGRVCSLANELGAAALRPASASAPVPRGAGGLPAFRLVLPAAAAATAPGPPQRLPRRGGGPPRDGLCLLQGFRAVPVLVRRRQAADHPRPILWHSVLAARPQGSRGYHPHG